MTFRYLLPRSPLPRISFAVLAVLVAVGISGCTPSDGGSTAQSSVPTLPTVPLTTTTSKTSTPPAAADYQHLLLSAPDLSDAEDTFTERSKESQPNGTPGASA